ncbi:MAG: hypothetical protein EHM88_14390 [Candidatus Rokuibacteriota bacterium]|nr:MAG: hypothetical protein EHM88_14390 [Candidatus Rokubacteria bacterium]
MAVGAGADGGGRAPLRARRRAGPARLHDPPRHHAHAGDRFDGTAVPRDAANLGRRRTAVLPAAA